MSAECSQDICYAVNQIKNSCGSADGVYYDKRNNVLCINGEIDVFGNMLNKIKSFKIKNGLKVSLESNGGGVTTAIGIVNYLMKYNYTAVVTKDCISSCAQFLFIGSNKRIIAEGGRVIFHGGPFTEDQIKELNHDKISQDQIRLSNNRFIKFYADRNISLDILYKQPDSLDVLVDFSGTK
jgi:ATP-dependent protease ClpP protease subunit